MLRLVQPTGYVAKDLTYGKIYYTDKNMFSKKLLTDDNNAET